MNKTQGITALKRLRHRPKEKRGGQSALKTDSWSRSDSDSLALWRDRYLAQLSARNYSPNTLHLVNDGIKLFINWAQDRDLTRASQIMRPMLESYQRWLWHYKKINGKPLGISTQRTRLSA